MAPTDTFDATFSHHTTRANGVRLHYVMGGEGDPVVLLHGWSQTWRGWRKVMPALAERHTVIAPDLRGMGDSEKPQGGYDGLTVAEDVLQLVRGLGFERFHLVAHDVGGWAAYPLAASYPEAVRSLAMVDSLPPGLGLDELSVTEENPLWHMAFHTAGDVAEMLVSGKEREYLSYFYRKYSYDPAAIGEEDVDESTCAATRRPAACAAGSATTGRSSRTSGRTGSSPGGVSSGCRCWLWAGITASATACCGRRGSSPKTCAAAR